MMRIKLMLLTSLAFLLVGCGGQKDSATANKSDTKQTTVTQTDTTEANAAAVTENNGATKDEAADMPTTHAPGVDAPAADVPAADAPAVDAATANAPATDNLLDALEKAEHDGQRSSLDNAILNAEQGQDANNSDIANADDDASTQSTNNAVQQNATQAQDAAQ